MALPLHMLGTTDTATATAAPSTAATAIIPPSRAARSAAGTPVGPAGVG